ncbi:MAG TPA: glycine cleavage system aminomethyltransferase GcvT [Casimicrobiaceae bacterium]|nr:glycine cleavage system aminomethyltransferase GcvT [Casimicrobiaceae bacterium]
MTASPLSLSFADRVPKTTVLNAAHRAEGARMVDFGGYDMPLHYGSQIDEHHAVRTHAGMFDVSHMRVVDVRGSDDASARSFLRYALANDVGKLATPGKALYSCLLREDGGVIDDLIVYFVGDDFFRLVVNAATADKDIAWLSSLAAKRAPRLSIQPRDDLAMIAVQGPHAREAVWRAIAGSEAATSNLAPFNATSFASRWGELFIGRTGYTGEDGFEIALPATHAVEVWQALRDAGVRPCGLGARDTLRLEAGMNLYGQDMDESVSPMESGLAWTVNSKDDRDFVGRDVLEAQVPKYRLAGLVLEGAGGVLRAHQTIHTEHGDGEITSGTFSPTMRKSIALARIPKAVADGERVRVDARGKSLEARVVKPPFVRNGRMLVA